MNLNLSPETVKNLLGIFVCALTASLFYWRRRRAFYALSLTKVRACTRSTR